jgi:hypothetical protein
VLPHSSEGQLKKLIRKIGEAQGFRIWLSWSRRWMAQRTWPPGTPRRLDR